MQDSPDLKIDRTDTALVLGVLSAIEQDARVTQRGLSSQLGIALGLANAVLKRCVRKGLIKIASAPLNRYAYYLTPSGLSEKGRLTVEYLRLSLDLFRDARRQYTDIFNGLAGFGLGRVALLGASELSEAAVLSARETGVEIVGLVDRTHDGLQFVGVDVFRDIGPLAGRVDALVLCDLSNPVKIYDDALDRTAEIGLDRSRVVAPDLLRLGKRRARQNAEAAP